MCIPGILNIILGSSISFSIHTYGKIFTHTINYLSQNYIPQDFRVMRHLVTFLSHRILPMSPSKLLQGLETSLLCILALNLAQVGNNNTHATLNTHQ